MKVLLVTASYLPDGQGGVEFSLARFARWARAQGHELRVFRRFHDPEQDEFLLREEVVDGVPVTGVNYRFGDAEDFLALVRNPRLLERYRTVLDSFQPDLVHVHHLTCPTTEIVEASQDRGAPVVLSLHDYWMGCPRGQRIRSDLTYCSKLEPGRCVDCYRETWPHWFSETRDRSADEQVFHAYHEQIREVLDRADALLVPSPFARRVFARQGVPRERLEVLEYGMETEAFADVPREPSGVFRVGFLGAVLPSKGVHILVDAFRRVGGSDRSLAIHGPVLPFHNDTGYGDRLQRLCQGWERQIRLHGPYDPSSTPGLLAGLDVLVVPSLWYETYCMVIREGFLAGVPVVASNLGAMAEAIEDGETGLLFPVGDSVQLAAQLERLAQDPELCKRLAASPKPVTTVAEHGARTLAIYERVLDGPVD